jgi:hypothetical protein
MQLHVAAFYLLTGLTMLNSEAWWSGEAMWWLAAHTESRLVDLTWLDFRPDVEGSGYLFNAWTHAVVLLQFAFPVLAWNRWARPLVFVAAVLIWGSLALVTGLVSYCLMLLVASLVFVSPEAMCHLGDRFRRQDAEAKSTKVRVPA